MKKIVVVVLALSLVGVGMIQYRFLAIGLKVAKARFDLQAREALQLASLELSGESQMSGLLASAVTADPGRLNVGLDTLVEASENFFNDFLKDRLLSQGLDFEFAYAITDDPETRAFLQSSNYNSIEATSRYSVPLEGYIPERCGCKLLLHLKAAHLLQYLLPKLNYLTIPFLLFFILIGACFVWLVRFLDGQRRLDEVKNDFINNLAHELKTPAFTIGLTANMLQETVASEQGRRYLDVIRKENENLKFHINKILELASLGKSGHILERQREDIHEVIRPAIEYYRMRIGNEGGSFSFTPGAARSTAFVDSAHLGNALQNLLENAIKYSPEEQAVMVKTFNRKGYIYISVTDQGIGIDKEEQKRIFERFYRVLEGGLHEAQGFGLGLSYVRQVAQLHGGKVEVESKPGRGSTFTLVIPVAD